MKSYSDLINWKNKNLDTKSIFFYLGVFLLPSAFSISIIFLFISFLLVNLKDKKKYLSDPWNIPFLIVTLLMAISSIAHFLLISNPVGSQYNPQLSFIGLFNWLPFFWIFWKVQFFLRNEYQMKFFIYILIAGTFPVIITGLGQYFFNWTGPFDLMNGLIIWYQRPIINPAGLTGLFNNPNIAGSWLNIVFPFSIATIYENSNNKKNKSIATLFLISIAICIVLTNSRNAWVGLFLSLPFLIDLNVFYYLLPFLILIGITLAITVLPIFQGYIQDQFRFIVPDKLWMEFTKQGFESMDISRIGIWSYAINFIFQSPLFGFGGAAFPIMLEMQSNLWKGHPHNLFLEVAISYGIPSALILFTTILLILILSFKKIYLGKFYKKDKSKSSYSYQKAWWTAFFILIISQSVDIQYFDGRISILFWILLAGLKNILTENKKIIADGY